MICTEGDAAGKLWLSYNNPHWPAQGHGVGVALTQIVNAVATTLNAIVTKATRAT